MSDIVCEKNWISQDDFLCIPQILSLVVVVMDRYISRKEPLWMYYTAHDFPWTCLFINYRNNARLAVFILHKVLEMLQVFK